MHYWTVLLAWIGFDFACVEQLIELVYMCRIGKNVELAIELSAVLFFNLVYLEDKLALSEGAFRHLFLFCSTICSLGWLGYSFMSALIVDGWMDLHMCKFVCM